MRDSPPYYAFLHNDIPPIHPHRFPYPRKILRRLLHRLFFTEIQEILRFAHA